MVFDSFVLSLWRGSLVVLGWLSPFRWTIRQLPRACQTYGMIDAWVMANGALSVIALVDASCQFCPPLPAILTIYAGFRILEIIVYQTNVVLVDPYDVPSDPSHLSRGYALRGYRRILILTLHNYAEVVLWFSAIYCQRHDLFGGDHAAVLSTASGALYYSMVTMTTVGYGDITPKGQLGQVLVTLHLVVAMLITVVLLARFVGYLPVPRTMDERESTATDPATSETVQSR